MNYFNKNLEESLRELNTDSKSGLSPQEAERRLKEYGPNRLEEQEGKSFLQIFLAQFKDFLVIILIIAALVSMVVGVMQNEGIFDSFVIIAIVIINAVIGAKQENQANNALKALKQLSSPQAKVIRGGVTLQIPSEELVIGDLVHLDAGDYIPADLRLTQSINLKVDESALTGESVSVEKDADIVLDEDAPIGDRVNSAFMGTVITYGRGFGIVSGTGMDTQMGNIAKMLSEEEEEPTPLQRKLDSLGKTLGIICIAVCVIIFFLGLYQGDDLMEIFMVAVSLAVAAIPEGLTMVVTVILSMGMQKMVKSNAIVKKLSAVETLGSTTVICSDKTGTLTQNQMTVVEAYDNFEIYTVTGTGYSPDGEVFNLENKEKKLSKNMEILAIGTTLCNDSLYDREKSSIIGDPTEGAMVVYADKFGIDQKEINEKYPRVQEIPFDSKRKLMSTFNEKDGKITMFTKGAPDELLKRCTHIQKDNEIIEIDDENRKRILTANENFAKRALRVLALAYKGVDNLDNFDEQEHSLIFTGLLCMIDPPREEVKYAVDECKSAGIVPKMITGDHKITASAIAVQLGIMEEGEEALEGSEIEALSDEELQEKVKTVDVFARVSPEHKVRIVSACKANGEIVAMTGDGVNDAPSLKRADIGVAMGITGTDVTKEASDMILTDDNFVSIVHAVEEGRVIYNNIRKVVGYLLSCNIGEILIIFFAMLVNLPVPLMPIHLLSVNLITDAFPAFALGMEEGDPNVMMDKPRPADEPIIDRKMRIAVGVQSIFLGVSVLLSFVVGRNLHGDLDGRTICFATLILAELMRAYANRSEEKSIFKMNLFSNSFLNKSVLLSLVFLVAVIYIPFLNPIFETTFLDLQEILVVLAFAFFPVAGGEIAKVFVRKMD